MSIPKLFEPDRLLSVIRRTEAFYAKRNQNFATLARWYFKDHSADSSLRQLLPSWLDIGPDLPLPSSDREQVSPINLPTHVINMAVSMLTQETPAIEVLVDGDSPRDRKRSALAEKVFMGVLFTNSELQGRDLLYEFIHNLLLYGWGVLRVVWDDSRVPESLKSELRKEVERSLEEESDRPVNEDDPWAMPIVIDCPHPAEIYPIPGGHRERWKGVFRRYEMTVEQAEEFFGIEFPKETPDERENDILIEVVDFWAWVGNEIWHSVLVTNYPLFEQDDLGNWTESGQKMHFIVEPTPMPEYQRLPYEIRFCFPTTDSRGENFGLSFLYTMIDAVREAEILASRLNMIIDAYADPVYKRVYNTEISPDATPPDVVRGPGQTIDVDAGKGQDVSILQWSGSPPDVKQLMDLWLRFAQEWSFDPSIEGRSGLDSIVLKSGILAKLSIPVRQIESALAAVHARIIHLFTELVKKPLRVRGEVTKDGKTNAYALDVSGHQLQGMQYAHFTVRARFPYEELQNTAMAQAAVQSGLMSVRRAMSKYLFIDDPEAEIDRIDEEQLSRFPGWIQGISQIVLQKMAELLGLTVPVAQNGTEQSPAPPEPQGAAVPESDVQQAVLLRNLNLAGLPESQRRIVDLINRQGQVGSPNALLRGNPGRPIDEDVTGTTGPGVLPGS